MQKIIVIGAICVLLAVATLVALKFLELGPFAKPPTISSNNQVPMKSIFFKVKPVTISVLDKNEVAANLKITIQLEAKVSEHDIDYQGSLRERTQKKEELKKHKIEKIMPRIENVFISELHAFVPRFFKKYNQIDDRVLGKRLLEIADRRLGKDLIFGVSTESIIEPPAN